ncbi:hypothetical protein SCATT_01290 [Streptantibioticus cattleyicolor NRRL 8057 = DSM 46488]|uniref:Uncharacterized protein n=1 Tax=Streptantibioticus cattleyicolor (strain ATCC 35852 / DSM 46488 / JCM 4925 / NBRC 14057 / NRRL 8057) TaxID=1003195 RepID=F8K310_STREN|nr:hypothetical protein SCATT_01290 [Streptantibioticus cattleyicolor NRRL 8057 = DSM 46488]MYS57302.1 hypothetical protein [Streptomyces sp. SID5468]CCB72859.1 protein of unknown function [Streptantibioticus cattleyicolor NRRL 8057 = DSM 46488]
MGVVDARADAELDGLPVALRGKVAAAQAAWVVPHRARHTVVPEHHWPHETDPAALRGARGRRFGGRFRTRRRRLDRRAGARPVRRHGLVGRSTARVARQAR